MVLNDTGWLNIYLDGSGWFCMVQHGLYVSGWVTIVVGGAR